MRHAGLGLAWAVGNVVLGFVLCVPLWMLTLMVQGHNDLNEVVLGTAVVVILATPLLLVVIVGNTLVYRGLRARGRWNATAFGLATCLALLVPIVVMLVTGLSYSELYFWT